MDGKKPLNENCWDKGRRHIKAVTAWVASAFPPHLWSMGSFQLLPWGEAGVQQRLQECF